VLFVGIPLLPSGSRLPVVASFPVLLRNALRWMLPHTEALRPGDRIEGPAGEGTPGPPGTSGTSRRTGFVAHAGDSKMHPFSVLSAEVSDLRRPAPLESESFARRRSLAMPLVLLAIALLGVEWGLFHRRLTE
jgi:hypothetical protein